MNPLFHVSNRRWRACALSLLVLAVVFGVRFNGLPAALRPDAEWQTLSAEKVRLAAFTAERVEALRREVAQARRRGVSQGDPVPAGWRSETVSTEAGGPVRVRFVHAEGALRWSELLAFVAELEERGGLVSLDLRSRGTRRKREIDRVEIVVMGALGTTRRPAGATFPGADVPDLPRKVGPGPSLRLPSAFTGRLRPPGSGCRCGLRSVPSRPCGVGRRPFNPRLGNRLQSSTDDLP
jgi:hypothetical protein